ncbi:uncharacterized protein LOC122847039 isoform X2 [Gambusia affinis]|uniref:uncharacterized protein LOC122847039 isoform X2 n=1 Tax=Gambusia affinis TaxID=33528 RepID=UPI001CDD5F94|nr:uncharacterized protein LOC122847039 isoform X2 [Gambusia affinis]
MNRTAYEGNETNCYMNLRLPEVITLADFSNCDAFQAMNHASTGCSKRWKSDHSYTRVNLLKVRKFDIDSKTRGRQNFTFCSTIVPGNRGTRTMADWYFLHTYASLPRNWGELCTLVPLSSPVTFLKRLRTLTAMDTTALEETSCRKSKDGEVLLRTLEFLGNSRSRARREAYAKPIPMGGSS